jgi:Transposase DDE domain group 1
LAANAVRLKLHALAYNLGNFMRTLAIPKAAEPWSLTSLREKLIKIGAKVVSHGRYMTFQVAEVAVSRLKFRDTLMLIAGLGIARISVRDAKIECDKQRRQVCALTKAKQQVLCATRREAVDSAARGTHRG